MFTRGAFTAPRSRTSREHTAALYNGCLGLARMSQMAKRTNGERESALASKSSSFLPRLSVTTPLYMLRYIARLTPQRIMLRAASLPDATSCLHGMSQCPMQHDTPKTRCLAWRHSALTQAILMRETPTSWSWPLNADPSCMHACMHGTTAA